MATTTNTGSKNLTDKEQEAVEALRTRIADVLDELDDFHKHDLGLLRFLRAHDLNVSKAEEILRNNMKWRKDNKIDEVLTQPHSKDIEDRFPFKLSGYDSEGSFISVGRMGEADYRSIIENGEKEIFEHYMIKMYELYYELFKFKSKQTGNFITSAVAIIDYEQFNGFRLLSSPETMKYMQKLTMTMQNNYPEIMKCCYIVNAPKLFHVLFTIFKPLMSKAMLEKIQVHGTNSATWKEALRKMIPADQLPSEYGGSNTCVPVYSFDMGFDVTPNLPPRYPAHEMKTEVVAAGQKFEIDFPIAENEGSKNTELLWNFRSDDYDIGFSLHLTQDGVKESEQLISIAHCDAHINVQLGRFVCDKPGKYTFCFDNSYSKFRSKSVYYTIKQEKID